MGLGRLERTLYRSLLRSARTFDREPVLKALICRNHGFQLPEPLDTLVNRFLNGGRTGPLTYYWPSKGGQQLQDVVRASFRQPPADAEVEGAFAGVRYLSGLLAIAQRHGMRQPHPAAAAAVEVASAAQQQQEGEGEGEKAEASAFPSAATSPDASSSSASGTSGTGSCRAERADGLERGVLLLAHPALGSIFSRSVVLLCRHEMQQGAYGIILNKPLGSNLRNLHDRLQQLQEGGGGGLLPAFGAGAAAAGAGTGAGGGLQRGSGSGDAMLAVDISADQLQEIVDFLANVPGFHNAAAAAAAAGPEHDEHGNWLDPSSSFTAASDSEDADLALPLPLLGGLSSSEDSGEDEGLGLGSAAGTQGGSGSSRDLTELLAQVLREVGPAAAAAAGAGDGDGEQVLEIIESPEEEDPTGVLAALGEALRRGGGGTVVMLDPQGQVWGQHLPPGDYSSQDDDANDFPIQGTILASDEEAEEAPGGVVAGAYALEEETPGDVADTILRSLSKQDRRLLRQLAQQQRQQQLLAASAAAPAPAPGAVLGGVDPQPTSSGSGSGSGGGGAMTSSSSDSSSEVGAGLAPTERFRREVDRLLAQAGAPPTAAAVETAAAGGAQQLQAGGLFGILSGGGGGGTQGGGGGGIGQAAAAAAPTGTGSTGSTGNGTTVSQLMTMFNESPLFRGGPVPGVQVLHRRPQLGGELVLPPWGTRPPADISPQLLAAATRASAGSAALPESAAGSNSSSGSSSGSGSLSSSDSPSSSGSGDPTAREVTAAEVAEAVALIETEAAVEAGLEGGLMVGAELARAKGLLESGYLAPQDVRVVMGDCGWGPGQLEGEVARGTWALVRATPDFLDLFGPQAIGTASAAAAEAGADGGGGALAGMVGEEAARAYEQQMWSKCLGVLGADYAELARVPRGVWADLADFEL